MYESEIDSKETSTIKSIVIKNEHLYFIVIDSNDNVFGHYHPSIIDRISNDNFSNIFIFTLNSNGRCEIKKFNRKGGDITYTCIWNSNDYYRCGPYGYAIRKIDTNNSFIDSSIEDYFSGIEKTILTGNYYPNYFTTKRIIVIQMK